MKFFLTKARNIFMPDQEIQHGPLPLFLLVLTVVTGLIDAFSYLILNHVFVANMTGNIVFLGFALAGTPDFSFLAELVALTSFVAGALIGGMLASRLLAHRGHLLSTSTALQTLLLGISTVLAIGFAPGPSVDPIGYSLIILLGLAMGLQNATARRLGIPELTTTVLTMTITSVVAELQSIGENRTQISRRILSVITLFLGAFIGSMLILHLSLLAPLIVAALLTFLLAIIATVLSRGNPPWVHSL